MPVSKVRKSVASKKGPTASKNRKPSVKQQNRERLSEQGAQLQGALIHLRQMYDQAMAEKSELQSGVTQRDFMLTALAVRYGNNGALTIPEEDIQAVANGDYLGYNVSNEDGIITIFAQDAEFVLEPEEDDEDDENESDAVVEASKAANDADDE